MNTSKSGHASEDDEASAVDVRSVEYSLLRTRDSADAWKRLTTSWARDNSFGNSKEYRSAAIQRKNARVRKLLDAQIKRNPRLAHAFALRAALPWRKDFPGVRADFDRAWELGLRSAALLTWRGTVRLKMLDREGGLADLKASLVQPDTNAWNWAWCGRAVLTQFRDPAGLSYMDRAAELAPRWSKIYVWRSEAKRHMGDLKGMTADYERALKLKPGPGLRDLLRGFHGMGLLQLGRIDDAIRELKRALKATPRRTLWAYGLSVAMRKAGRLEEWVEYLDRAARLDLKYENMPGSWSSAERAGALRDMDAVVARSPRNALARRWRAKLLLASGRAAEAEADLAISCRAEPRRAANWLWHAEALRAAGRTADARRSLARAARLNPRGEEIALARARLEDEAGDAEAALSYYEAALKIEGRHVPAHAEKGALLLKLGRDAEALAALEMAAALSGRDVRGLADLTAARRRAGDAAGAEAAWRRALALDAEFARRRLAEWEPPARDAG
ncbi:MAG: tetratricopeptide repeat protein [Elusimicrobiota bacterium]